MAQTSLEAVLKRDRLIVLTSIAVITVLSWAYLFILAAGMRMDDGPMEVMDAMAGMAPQIAAWSAVHAIFVFSMWAVMMTGMMTPSVAPMILLYARVGRQAVSTGQPFAASAWFAGGYFLSWIGFAAIATFGQWLLTEAALLSPMMVATSQKFGALVLIAAGAYQLTPLKDSCLSHCQSPLAFLQHHGGFQSKPLGAIRIGVQHGFYCIGCCWALMTLLFVGGVMNLFWIAGLSLFVLAEKILPPRWRLQKIGGALLLAIGLLMMI